MKNRAMENDSTFPKLVKVQLTQAALECILGKVLSNLHVHHVKYCQRQKTSGPCLDLWPFNAVSYFPFSPILL